MDMLAAPISHMTSIIHKSPSVPTIPNPSLLHMYNRDMTVLYYRSNSPRAFFRAGIHPATLEKHLTKGTYYLGEYKFRREFVPLAKYKKTKPSFVELQLMLKKDRGGNSGR
jgi:hypothetical protein